MYSPGGNNRPVLLILLGVGVVAVLVFFANRIVEREGVDLIFSGVDDADVQADWLVTRAAWDGTGAYEDPDRLASHYGVNYAYVVPEGVEKPESGASHPRTPGALLLQTPLLLVEFDGLYLISVVANVALIALLGAVCVRLVGWPNSWMLLVIPLVVVSRPSIWTVRFGAQSVVVALLLAYVWVSLGKGDSVGSGLALSVAATLKVFPLLLIPVAFVLGRRKAAMAALIATAALGTAGLLLPGVQLDRAIAALAQNSSLWVEFGANGSMAGALTRVGMDPGVATIVGLSSVVIATAVLLVWGKKSERTVLGLLAITTTLALLGPSLSWLALDLLIVPIALWLVSHWSIDRPAAVVGIVWVAAQFLGPTVGPWVGLISFAGRALVAGGILWRLEQLRPFTGRVDRGRMPRQAI